jgi:NADH-quinone oxidoreductase subunit L
LGAAIAVFLGGTGLAYWIYALQQGKPARSFAEAAPWFHSLVYDKWRVDEFYEEYVIGALDSLADFFAWADKWIVDFILARLSAGIVSASGTLLRFFQTGRVQTYAAVMVLGLGGLGWFVLAPRAEAVVSNDEGGSYSLSAPRGLGYSYRWDTDNDGKWDGNAKFGSKTEASVTLKAKENRTVRLEVKNAFGRTAVAKFDLEREAPDLSGNLGPAGSPATRRFPNPNQLAKPQGAQP